MVRALFVALILAAFGMVMAGCKAQGSVAGNEASSMMLAR